MVNRVIQLSFCVTVALVLCSCSGSADYGKKTYPVTGSVFVDGQPAALLTVTLHDVKGFDSANPSVSTAMTKDDGTFSISTFEAEDGVPVGEYTATFEWGKLNPIKNVFEGDQLNGKYMDPKKSEVKVTVAEGKPTDMGQIDLKKK